MRQAKNKQLQFGELPIEQIQFPTRSRDDVPQLLRGLHYIYLTPAVREEVFRILVAMADGKADRRNGRLGMDLWKVLVVGTLQLNLNWDYDRLNSGNIVYVGKTCQRGGQKPELHFAY